MKIHERNGHRETSRPVRSEVYAYTVSGGYPLFHTQPKYAECDCGWRSERPVYRPHEHWLKHSRSLEIGGTVIQTIPDIAGRDIRTSTSDPDCEED